MNLISQAVNWPFLNEPIYRWFIFAVAFGFIMTGWHGVLDFMK